ncbi:hypothetical protein P0L94_15005 [Microbacter sp. GSS18]|nr:hypothetical protein P0L94_15005 [Microbacter sp. GSS18]
MPEPIAVELNSRPEKSACVPSSEKCRRHHSESLVVNIAIPTPTARMLIASMNDRWERGIEGGSPLSGGASGSAAVDGLGVIVDVVIVLPRVDGPLRARPPGTESRSERRRRPQVPPC